MEEQSDMRDTMNHNDSKHKVTLGRKVVVSSLAVMTLMGTGSSILPTHQVTVTSEVHAATMKLSATSQTIYRGNSTKLKVSGTKKKVKWSSTNKKIATVTSKGKVTAKKAGTCYIKAKVGKKTLKCKITVKNAKLSMQSMSIVQGHSSTLKVVGGSHYKWTWSSSSSRVAKVNSKGKVTAVNTGLCYIYAKTKGQTLKCMVYIPESLQSNISNAEVSLEAIVLINQEREKRGLNELVYKDKLGEAARIRASEVQTMFSHNRPNGEVSSTVLLQVGYPVKISSKDNTILGHAECIGDGFTTADAIIKTWKNSRPHWNTLMDKNNKYIAIAKCGNTWVALTEYY